MTIKPKKSGLDVSYLRTTPSTTLAAGLLATTVQEKKKQLVHEQTPSQVSIDRLLDNPYQPRVSMDEESLQQLAETIIAQGFHGVLVARPHPSLVGNYQITAGHRRREAAKRAGLRMLPVIVSEWSEQEMAILAATENIQREDLSPLEEGRLFQLMSEEMGMTQVEIANMVKKDRGYVRNRLRIASAPEDIQAFVETKTDSLRAVIYLLEIEDEQERAILIDQLLKKTLLTEDLASYVEDRKREGPVEVIPTIPQTQTSEKSPVPEKRKLEEGTSSSSGQAMSAERIRSTRLKTILRTLSDYRKRLTQQDPPSQEERDLLQQILSLAQNIVSLW
jgi:ParB family chromosome partitioning protein